MSVTISCPSDLINLSKTADGITMTCSQPTYVNPSLNLNSSKLGGAFGTGTGDWYKQQWPQYKIQTSLDSLPHSQQIKFNSSVSDKSCINSTDMNCSCPPGFDKVLTDDKTKFTCKCLYQCNNTLSGGQKNCCCPKGLTKYLTTDIGGLQMYRCE